MGRFAAVEVEDTVGICRFLNGFSLLSVGLFFKSQDLDLILQAPGVPVVTLRAALDGWLRRQRLGSQATDV